MKVEECPCNKCKKYLGWITIKSPDEVLRSDMESVDRPWCYRYDEACQPHKHGCMKEGGAK